MLYMSTPETTHKAKKTQYIFEDNGKGHEKVLELGYNVKSIG